MHNALFFQPLYMRIDYHTYIHSEEWELKRQLVFKNQKTCQKCWTEHYLNVHHWTYKRLWSEKLSDLFVICSDCHKKFHEQFWVKNNMMKLTRKYLWLTRKKIQVKVQKKIKEKQTINKNKKRFKNKIFELDYIRALHIMNILENLSKKWKCNYQNAEKEGITYGEWLKTQHFFLSVSKKYKDNIIYELNQRISKNI